MRGSKPTLLLILDGFGLNDNPEGNAIAMANTPNLDKLMKEYPFVKGNASGLAVGLPDGQMGNSEVGHMNMGAGRIVYQELTRITKSIEDGDFFENEALLDAVNNCKANDSALHMFGLVSDGGVHSHITHIYGLLELAKRHGLKKVYVHCFLDGRDTPPESGIDFVQQLEDKMKELGVGEIASLSGRYYAMDRDNNYDRVVIAYDALTKGEGQKASSAHEGMQQSYDNGKTDEFVVPTVIMKDGQPVATIKDNDSVVFFNFRPDRAREMTHSSVMIHLISSIVVLDLIPSLYASQIMIRLLLIKRLHSRKFSLLIHSENGLQIRDSSRHVSLRLKNMLTLPSSSTAVLSSPMRERTECW